MSTNEFDKLIAKSVSRLSYEYDANDWENLTIQLAAARRKKRTVVLAYLSSGIAAAVVIFLIGIMSLHPEKKMPAIQFISAAHTTPPLPSTISGNTSAQVQSQAVQLAIHRNAPVIFSGKQARHLSPAIADSQPPVAYDNQLQNPSTITEEKQVDTFNFAQGIKQHGYEEPLLSYSEKENIPDHKGINISVAAGVNYGTVNTGYAVGAAAGKRLSNKFGLELTVAYVSNNATTYGAQSLPPNGGPIYGPPTKPTPLPEVISPLNYLQFSPMADYSVSKKITLSAGADIQRLLQDHDFTILYNDNPRIAPAVDLGMLLRTEYAISPVFKAGISYRLGANNIVAPGNNYFDRNYMQIQLKYRLH
ncbi:MAG: hypothetical protein ACTHJ0_10985 [Flavipsychrobacter sp.]